ncbi:MAG: AraC family transcriptional regulator [Acidobacteriota bacterium]
MYGSAGEDVGDVFYTVPRAGHLVAGSEHGVKREHFPGHELIYCLGGRGWVRGEGGRNEVGPGDLAWVNCHHPHAHGAVREDPWEVYWVRVEGPRLEQLAGKVAGPVVRGVARELVEPVYREIFGLVEVGGAGRVHAAVARLLAVIWEAGGGGLAAAPAGLGKVMTRMKLFYFEPLTVAGLAAEAGMSPSHFARRFREVYGTSPIDWLRRERIRQAQRRLGDTEDPVQWIAEQVGYRDRFFFSKDFKRLTGYTPREYRRREAGSPRKAG